MANDGTPTSAQSGEPAGGQRRHARAGSIGGMDLHARVVEDVGQRIVNGELPIGSTIFADQLCTQLQISRSVVREGLRTLSSLGMVHSRPQRGTRVQPRSHWDLLSPYVIRWRGQGPDHVDQMMELLELRLGVERSAAYFATTRMTESDASTMLRAAHSMREAFDAHDRFAYFRADADFHRSMLEGSGNPVIAQFADTVTAQLSLRGATGARSYTPHGISATSVANHIALAEAVGSRDRDLATSLAEQIIVATIAEVESMPEFKA